jgi:hypothetical protein
MDKNSQSEKGSFARMWENSTSTREWAINAHRTDFCATDNR